MYRQFSPARERMGFTLIELLVVIAILGILVAILFPVFGRARESARRSACQSNLKQIGLGVAQYSQDYDELLPMDRGGDPNGNTGFNSLAAFNGDLTVAINLGIGISWAYRIQPYVQSKQIFNCPSTKPDPSNPAGTAADQTISYWVPEAVMRTVDSDAVHVSLIRKPAETPYAYDNMNGTRDARRVFRPHWDQTTYGMYTSLGSFTTSKPGTHFDGMNTLYVDGHVKWQKLLNLFLQLCPQWTPANSGQTDCTAGTEL